MHTRNFISSEMLTCGHCSVTKRHRLLLCRRTAPSTATRLKNSRANSPVISRRTHKTYSTDFTTCLSSSRRHQSRCVLAASRCPPHCLMGYSYCALDVIASCIMTALGCGAFADSLACCIDINLRQLLKVFTGTINTEGFGWLNNKHLQLFSALVYRVHYLHVLIVIVYCRTPAVIIRVAVIKRTSHLGTTSHSTGSPFVVTSSYLRLRRHFFM